MIYKFVNTKWQNTTFFESSTKSLIFKMFIHPYFPSFVHNLRNLSNYHITATRKCSNDFLQSSRLLLVHLDDIILLHLESLGGFVVVDSSSVEEETQRCDGDSNPLGVGLLEFSHLGGLLHSEVDLVGVLSNNFELDVLSVVSSPSSLLLIHLDDVILLHLESFGGFVVVDPPSVEEESQRSDGDSHPLRVGFLELPHLGCLLHPEVDLVGVLSHHLELDVLRIIPSSSCLLLVHLDDVILFHLQSFRRLVVIDSSSIKKEAKRRDGDSNPFGVGFLEFSHLGGLFHPEMDFVGILANNLELNIFRIIASPSGLLLVHLYDVILFHLQSFRRFIIVDPPPVKKEAERCDGDSHPLGVGLLQLPHLGGLLHPEVDLIAVLSHHLELDVLSVVSSHLDLSLVSTYRLKNPEKCKVLNVL